MYRILQKIFNLLRFSINFGISRNIRKRISFKLFYSKEDSNIKETQGSINPGFNANVIIKSNEKKYTYHLL